MSCPVCAAAEVELFLERRGVPVHQNALMDSEAAALSAPRGDLELAVCARCGFVFNAAFDASKLAYAQDYENTQNHSPLFDDYLDAHVRHMVDECEIRGKRIVEVGCGKGAFLRKLVEADAQNLGWGFDPSHLGPEIELGGRLQFRREFYGATATEVAADAVVCRHVIEHVPDPVELLRNIQLAIAGRLGARLFFETPCFEWILDGAVFWDLFYEHCNYFTEPSIVAAFERAGFGVTSLRRVFGGQYFWLEAQPAVRSSYRPTPRHAVASCRDFAANVGDVERSWRERLQSLSGTVALWGAGAKGVTLANLIDPERRLLRCVVDINPRKQGHFIPGTGHAIVAPSELERLGVEHVVVMNPIYLNEVREQTTGAPVSVHAA